VKIFARRAKFLLTRRSLVAQISNLLYRRLAVGSPSERELTTDIEEARLLAF
jgi:hypothetical protein